MGVPEAPPTPTLPQRVLFFDGVCNLCNAVVRFVIRHDRHRHFHFASLQRNAGTWLPARYHSTDGLPGTFVYKRGGHWHTMSTGALYVARDLGFPWSIAFALIIIPKPIRDAVYALVARKRYRWFGKRETCMVPTAEVADRFLD